MFNPLRVAVNFTAFSDRAGLISTWRLASGTQLARQSLTRTTSQGPSAQRSTIWPSRRKPRLINSGCILADSFNSSLNYLSYSFMTLPHPSRYLPISQSFNQFCSYYFLFKWCRFVLE